jgi:hypothetical protein
MTIKTAEIAALNDLFRTGTNPDLGKWFITRGIQNIPLFEQFTVLTQVRTFTDFSDDNNPHGERDFGAFDHNGQRIFWKIDYYNRTLDGGSEDPADPFKTRRVLTVMLASEY